MYYVEVAPTKIIRAGSEWFTYSSDHALEIGAIVEIEVGKSTHIGVVVELAQKPSYAVKPITRLIEPTPLPANLVALTRWMSRYYQTPLATCVSAILPRGITKKRRDSPSTRALNHSKRTAFVLTKAQQAALRTLADARGTMLLHGVTGAGKTAVYIEQAAAVVAAGRSVIVLVPEIALTSQLVAEFSQRFTDVLVTHSRQTEAERHRTWQTALTAERPLVAIGPRSALFLPLKSVGMIVIDECHEPSFQQEQSPRYSALRVASKYAELCGGLSVLGSATPLVADYYLAETAGRVITLPERARTDALAARVQLIDMTKRTHFRDHRFLSGALLEALTAAFAAGQQALIFHNRRGSAPTTLCEQCGWQAGCPKCYVPLTLHGDHHELRCHICSYKATVPTSCPQCHHASIIHKGIGTKLIETELRKLFPKQSIARFDGDTDTADMVSARYDELKNGSIDLIIGTQVIAKGLDLPHLTVVGVVQADGGLSLPDYSSSERTFQLLAQVIGRVGRSNRQTSVIIQSYQPDHPVITDGIAQDYASFYERTLALRHRTRFPPDRFLLKLTCVYKTEAAAVRNARQLLQTLRQTKAMDVELLGPTPAFYERVGDTYRWQIVAKSPNRRDLLTLLSQLPPKHWQYELDPLSLL